MIKKFSPKTKEALGYYVYVYSDPDTKKPFYVGKGRDDRAFSHLNEYERKKIQKNEDNEESDKLQKIKEIKDKHKDPIIEILAHGLDEETSLKVEAAAIDLIGIDNLTNLQRGYKSSTYGKIEVSTLDARYTEEDLKEEDIIDNIMFIKINKRYRNDMSPLELYESTRGYWRLNVENAKKVDYALSVYEGMVLEVYEIKEWFPALSTYMGTRSSDPKNVEKRYEFVGKIADESVRKRYVNKSVKSFFKHGESNPFRYIWGKK